MKLSVAFKAFGRSTLKVIIMFVLLFAMTTTFMSQALEGVMTNREFKKAIEGFNGVLSVEVSPLDKLVAESSNTPAYIYSDIRVSTDYLSDRYANLYRKAAYKKLEQKQIESILALPYISSIDTRYMTAGVSDTYERLDDGREFFAYTNICVIEATVEKHTAGKIAVGNIELVGGIPIQDFGNDKIYISAQFKGLGSEKGVDYNIQSGRAVQVNTAKSEYDYDYLETLVIGNRYLFILRYEDYVVPRPDVYTYYLTDSFAYGVCDAVWCVENEPENYIHTEKFKPVKEYIDLIETDQHTFDVVYTGNMSSIRYFADNTIGISEGRGITTTDTGEVCVINHDLALKYGLKLGDTITIKLGNKLFEQHKGVGALAVVPERMSTKYTEVELEIIGIYKDTRKNEAQAIDPNWSYSESTIFVPTNLLAVEAEYLANHTFAPGEVSFVIENAWDIPAFRAEVLPVVEEMMNDVYFSDGGWSDLIEEYNDNYRASILKTAVLGVALILLVFFVAFIYVISRKKEYAIMRALGTTKKEANHAILMPLVGLMIVSVVCASILSVIYVSRKGTNSLSILGYENNYQSVIPVWVIGVCVIIELILIVVFTMLLLDNLGRKPLLAVLQNSDMKRPKEARGNISTDAIEEIVELKSEIYIPVIKPKSKKKYNAFVLKYIARHCSRAKIRSMLVIIIVTLLFNIIAQIDIIRNSYVNIYENTEIISSYAGLLNLDYVMKLQTSGYVKNVYYEKKQVMDADLQPTAFCITNDIDRWADEEVEYTFLDGYNTSIMSSFGNHIIVGQDLMMKYDLQLGDIIEVTRNGFMKDVEKRQIQEYRSMHYDSFMLSDEEIITICKDRIYDEYNMKMQEFKIIGCVSSKSGKCNKYMFISGVDDVSVDYGILLIPSVVEATLKNNWQVDEYRTYGLSLANANMTGEVAFIMDTSQIDGIKNSIDLIDILYPISFIMALAVGIFICNIQIVQSIKEIAIMRVLGTSKRKTCLIIVLEKFLLCCIGASFSIIVFHVRGILGRMWESIYIYLIVILLFSTITTFYLINRKVLTLLQVKE